MPMRGSIEEEEEEEEEISQATISSDGRVSSISEGCI
jgi:hypothetical protein